MEKQKTIKVEREEIAVDDAIYNAANRELERARRNVSVYARMALILKKSRLTKCTQKRNLNLPLRIMLRKPPPTIF